MTREELYKLVSDGEIHIVEFGANNCAACRAAGMVQDRLKKKYPDVRFTQVRLEASPELSADFTIDHLPYTQVWKDKEIQAEFQGLCSAKKLEEIIEDLKS